MTDEDIRESVKLSGLTEIQWIRNSMKIIAELKIELADKPKRVWTYEELEREARSHE